MAVSLVRAHKCLKMWWSDRHDGGVCNSCYPVHSWFTNKSRVSISQFLFSIGEHTHLDCLVLKMWPCCCTSICQILSRDSTNARSCRQHIFTNGPQALELANHFAFWLFHCKCVSCSLYHQVGPQPGRWCALYNGLELMRGEQLFPARPQLYMRHTRASSAPHVWELPLCQNAEDSYA